MQIEILNETALRGWCARLRMPDDAAQALARVAQAITADPELLERFSELYEQMAVRGEWRKEWGPFPIDAAVDRALGQEATLFYLLAYLSALPRAWSRYQQMGVSAEIFEATHEQITFYYLLASKVHGHWYFDQFGWIWRHLNVELFRLGRLQFMLADYNGHARAFRHRQTGEIRLLCGPDFTLRADGYAEGAGGQPSGGETWQSIFEASPEGWRGNLVAPRGNALREPVFLPCAEWEACLQPGDTILDLHIPHGTSLTTEECRDSFQQARAFFARHFPERPYQGAFCHTWFFTPQLQTLLPPESAIVRFQREFYLYPHPGGPNFLWTFAFGDHYKDRATAPRDTFLRRAVLDWLEEGKEIFDMPGVMFHGSEEWGMQPYMTRWNQ